MTLPLFLLEPEGLVGASAGTTLRLEGDEGRHAAVVRRIGPGEQVLLGDGAGRQAVCDVLAADRVGLTCKVVSVQEHPVPGPRIVVVQALTKGDRGERAVETLTEVGVDVIVPWAASRSVVQWRGDRIDKGVRRWQVIAREAAKQARSPWVPEVTTVASLSDVRCWLDAAALPVLLHEDAHIGIHTLDIPTDGDVVIVVGPEGGITPEERTALGVEPIRLGPVVLRAATAGTVAAAVLLARSPRWLEDF